MVQIARSMCDKLEAIVHAGYFKDATSILAHGNRPGGFTAQRSHVHLSRFYPWSHSFSQGGRGTADTHFIYDRETLRDRRFPMYMTPNLYLLSPITIPGETCRMITTKASGGERILFNRDYAYSLIFKATCSNCSIFFFGEEGREAMQAEVDAPGVVRVAQSFTIRTKEVQDTDSALAPIRVGASYFNCPGKDTWSRDCGAPLECGWLECPHCNCTYGVLNRVVSSLDLAVQRALPEGTVVVEDTASTIASTASSVRMSPRGYYRISERRFGGAIVLKQGRSFMTHMEKWKASRLEWPEKGFLPFAFGECVDAWVCEGPDDIPEIASVLPESTELPLAAVLAVGDLRFRVDGEAYERLAAIVHPGRVRDLLDLMAAGRVQEALDIFQKGIEEINFPLDWYRNKPLDLELLRVTLSRMLAWIELTPGAA